MAYPHFADPMSTRHQFPPHLGPAELPFDFCMDGANVRQQCFVAHAFVSTGLTGFGGFLASTVLKVAAGAHAQHLAGQGDGPVGFVAGNPGVLHSDSRAKYAVAFFRISRSIVMRANCALRRASSICSALTGLSPAPVSWPLALSLTQLSRLALGMPNTLTVTDTACPPLTSLTASILNASVYLARFLVSLIAFTLN